MRSHRLAVLADHDTAPLRLGIRANLGQFAVQTLTVFFVGVTLGLERTVVPLLAKDEFAIRSAGVIVSFAVSFGVVKAALNLWGGAVSERIGRKPLLVAGWLAAVPVPFLIIHAPNWWWVVAANLLLGVNQGLTWSMTVTAKLDIVGSHWRGFATGFNEFAGYAGVALSALATGYLASAYGLRPIPFYFGLSVILLALGVALLFARETIGFARMESATMVPRPEAPSFWGVFQWTTWQHKEALALCQAGLVEKFVDALVWVGFPLYFAEQGLKAEEIGLIVAVYGLCWGVFQLVSGPLSDRVGRKPLIVAGMPACGLGVALTTQVDGTGPWLASAALTGLGMALIYPTLIAAIGDMAHPSWRGTSLGVYRFWRDGGIAIGAALIGLVADTANLEAAFYAVAGAVTLSGLAVAGMLRETAPQVSSARR